MTSAERKEAISAFIFLSPFLVWMVFLMGGPILAAFFLSFCKWDILTPIQFVGFDNYKEMFFNDPRFWKALFNTAYFTFLSVPIGMVLSIVVALLMNQKVKGIGAFRTLFYLPSVVGAGVAIAVLWKWIFNADSGLVKLHDSRCFEPGRSSNRHPHFRLPQVDGQRGLEQAGAWSL